MGRGMSPAPREAEPLAGAPGAAGGAVRERQAVPAGPAVRQILRQTGGCGRASLGIKLN